MDNKAQSSSGTTASIGFLLYRSGLSIARGYERALAPLGVNPAQAGVLTALADGGPMHVRGLGRLLGLGRQTIVNVAKELTARSLLERCSDPTDERRTLLQITIEGRALLDQVRAIAIPFDAEIEELIGPDHLPAVAAALARVIESPGFAHE